MKRKVISFILCLVIVISFFTTVTFSADAAGTVVRYEGEDYTTSVWTGTVDGIEASAGTTKDTSIQQTTLDIPVTLPHSGTYEITVKWGVKTYTALQATVNGVYENKFSMWHIPAADDLYGTYFYTKTVSLNLDEGKVTFSFYGYDNRAIYIDYIDVVGYAYEGEEKTYQGENFENVTSKENVSNLGGSIDYNTPAIFAFYSDAIRPVDMDLVWAGSGNKKITVYLNDVKVFEGSKDDLTWNTDTPDTIKSLSLKEGTNVLKFTSEETDAVLVNYFTLSNCAEGAAVVYGDSKITVVPTVDAKVYVASYTDTALTSIKIHDAKMNTKTEIPFVAGQKAFVWTQNIVPLCKPYTIE